jgi:hypothetical protein
VTEDVVELTGDAQPFLDRAAAGLLLAGLGLAGKLSAGGCQQCPVVADRRAGIARATLIARGAYSIPSGAMF